MLRKLALVLRMVKVQHTLFALPFALSAMVMAAGRLETPALFPDFKTALLIVIEILVARNAAMTFNRILDREYDARNPRTKERELPSGKISLGFAIGFCAINAALFIAGACMINPLCAYLAPAFLVVLLGYSFLKRLTWTAHFVLGLALGLAPIGAWIAVLGSLTEPLPVLLGAAVLFWTAGFDVLYSTLDIEVDRKEGLHSIPARFGFLRALVVARVCHALMFLLLCARLFSPGETSYPALGALFLIFSLILRQHAILRPDDPVRVNAAFFRTNALISLIYLGGTLGGAFAG